MKLLKVIRPFTLDIGTFYKPANAASISFKEGDIIKVDELHRSRGGSETGIPVLCTDKNYHFFFTRSSNLKITDACPSPSNYYSSYDEEEECINPNAPTIDMTGKVKTILGMEPVIGYSVIGGGTAIIAGLIIYFTFKK